MIVVVSVGYLLIGVALGIGAYCLLWKMQEVLGFGEFAMIVCVSAVFWLLILPIVILLAVAYALYWAVCKYIIHEDIDLPFDL